MSKAKIMLFSHICGSNFITGAEKYILMLAGEAGERFDCILVVPEEGILLTEAKQRGIRTVVDNYPLVWPMYDPGANLITDVQRSIQSNQHGSLVNLLHMHQPDLIIVNTSVNPLPAIAAKVLDIPVAWFITEKIMEQQYTLQTVELINRYSDWIIGISDTTLRPFRQAGLEHKLSMLPPTWRMQDLQPEEWPAYRQIKRGELGWEPHHRVIGYISSSHYPEKGLEHFIHMALNLCEQSENTRFFIVGNAADAAYLEYCLSTIERSGHAWRFQRLPFQARIELVFPAMDLVVIPSLVDEGFGLTALEGLVFGKHVVAYRSGGLEEILQATENGTWLVEKGDSAGLIYKVSEWLNQAESAAASQFEAVEKAFGMDTYRIRLHQLLSDFEQKCIAIMAERNSHPQAQLLNNTIYKGCSAAAVFLLENGWKRPFSSEHAFNYFRFRWSDVTQVADALLHRFPTGAPICSAAPFHQHGPSVMLAKGSGPTVYLLISGRRLPFSSIDAMRQRGFAADRVVQVSDGELLQLPEGEALGALHTRTTGQRGKRKRKKSKLLRGRRTKSGSARRKRADKGKTKGSSKGKTKRKAKKVTTRLRRTRINKPALGKGSRAKRRPNSPPRKLKARRKGSQAGRTAVWVMRGRKRTAAWNKRASRKKRAA